MKEEGHGGRGTCGWVLDDFRRAVESVYGFILRRTVGVGVGGLAETIFLHLYVLSQVIPKILPFPTTVSQDPDYRPFLK